MSEAFLRWAVRQVAERRAAGRRLVWHEGEPMPDWAAVRDPQQGERG